MDELKNGKIVFELANAGSKSESEQPFLVDPNGGKTRLFVEGDNPFENNALRRYEGMQVQLGGEFDEKANVFVAKSVSVEGADTDVL